MLRKPLGGQTPCRRFAHGLQDPATRFGGRPTLQPRNGTNGSMVPHHWMVIQIGAPASEGDLSGRQDKCQTPRSKLW